MAKAQIAGNYSGIYRPSAETKVVIVRTFVQPLLRKL
jgi:hypothetical protein